MPEVFRQGHFHIETVGNIAQVGIADRMMDPIQELLLKLRKKFLRTPKL